MPNRPSHPHRKDVDSSRNQAATRNPTRGCGRSCREDSKTEIRQETFRQDGARLRRTSFGVNSGRQIFRLHRPGRSSPCAEIAKAFVGTCSKRSPYLGRRCERDTASLVPHGAVEVVDNPVVLDHPRLVGVRGVIRFGRLDEQLPLPLGPGSSDTASTASRRRGRPSTRRPSKADPSRSPSCGLRCTSSSTVRRMC